MESLNHQYTYAFSRLTPRDAVVFKSIVGLLNGRTCARWEHISEGAPDLLVMGCDQVEPTDAVGSPKVILRISPSALAQDPMCVHWPLRATEVFERLELAARLVTESAVTQPSLDVQRSFKLMGWPSQRLLGRDPHYLRLATLLGARAMTVAELSERAHLELARCSGFIEQLEVLGLLQVHSAPVMPNASTEVAVPAPGFFARLRAHLGLASAKAGRV